jgi:geranylgeranyl pyrophosphate synthase
MYQAIHNYLFTTPIFQTWEEPRRVLQKFISMSPRDWRLPLITCEAVCGSGEPGLAAAAALACTQIGIILVDDMLDNDPRGEFQKIGVGQTANLAATFLCGGQQAILYSQVGWEMKCNGLQVLNQMMQTVSYGQYLDMFEPQDEDAYWQIVESKSGSFFGSAMYMGALFGGASGCTTKALEGLGRIYGEMIQIHDDLHDTMERPANPDWLQKRSPLPILFSRLVDHPDRSRFIELCQMITEEGALEEAQEIIIRSGAVSYCVHQLTRKFEKSHEILAGLSLRKASILGTLLDEVAAPVQKLMNEVKID